MREVPGSIPNFPLPYIKVYNFVYNFVYVAMLSFAFACYCYLLSFSELIEKLITMEKEIYLVSGGFQSIIKPIAGVLGVKETNIFANKILFDFEGMVHYSSVDTLIYFIRN